MEQFVVSARKYRPATFETVVGQDSISTTLKNAIQRKQLAHAYLFCGPRGVGKTTCARIFAKTINCLNPTSELEACGECESCKSFAEGRSYSIHELDAASNNSVEDIRILTDQVRVPPQIGKYSVYIIDEVHMLSSAAFNAFLKTLEEPPAHAIFILATTEKHKILPTILSRCQIYDFNRISIEGMVQYLKNIAEKENVTVEAQALNIIAQKADGAMRDALSLFDQAVAFCGTTISYEAIIKNLHVVDYKYYFSLTDYFLENRYADALLLFDEVLSKGFDALHFIAGLSEHFRNLLVCKDAVTLNLFESGDAFKKDYLEQTKKCSIDFLFEALQLTNACEVGYKSSGNPRLHVELTLLRLSNIGAEKKNDEPIAVENSQPTIPVATSPENDATKPVQSSTPTKSNFQNQPTVEKPTAPPKSFSLKNAIAEKTTKENEEPIVTREKRAATFSEEQLIAVWKKLADNEKGSRLANALRNTNPQIREDQTTIVCFVLNAAQKQWMEENKAKQIINSLREELQNDLLHLEVAILPNKDNEKDDATKGIYTDEQKLNFLKENYPAVQKLKQTLGLDTK